MAELDHLVVAARSLPEGRAWLEQRLGVPMSPGGQHLPMGTHNALLSLGPSCYLEVISIDPSLPTPTRPRWFALDDPAMQARLAVAPALVHWVVRTEDLAGDAALLKGSGPALPMRRGDFAWHITVPDDGSLPADGVSPTLIQWATADHPCQRLPDPGVRLDQLQLSHPDAERISGGLTHIGLGAIAVSVGPHRMSAQLRVAGQSVTL